MQASDLEDLRVRRAEDDVGPGIIERGDERGILCGGHGFQSRYGGLVVVARKEGSEGRERYHMTNMSI